METYVELTKAAGGVAAVPAACSRRPERVEVRACADLLMRNAAAASRRHGLTGLLGLAVLATFSPGFHSWCVLDRDALAAGEVWRFWTGHLAHFSTNHLLVDAAVLALLATALLRSGERRFGRLVFLGGAGLGASLLLCDASLARYGGLSGLNALLLARLAVRWFQAGGRLRVLGVTLLAVAVGKFSLDSVGWGGTGVALLSAGVVPSQLSHWLGLVWGLALPAANRIGAGGREKAGLQTRG